MLTGFKTYIVVAVAIISALFGYLARDLTLLQFGSIVGLAIALGGNRAIAALGERWNDPRIKIVASPPGRTAVTYGGAALAILTAILAGLAGEQTPALTIGIILLALGLAFLGAGVQKAVQT